MSSVWPINGDKTVAESRKAPNSGNIYSYLLENNCNEEFIMILWKKKEVSCMKGFFRAIFATIILAGLMIIPASAAEDKAVNWGDERYQIMVPGFIETRDMTINGETTTVVVVQKPEKNAENKYRFFDVVTTDTNAVSITSTVLKVNQEYAGDLMTDLENGRVSYVPFLDGDIEDLSKEPIYLGFSFRDSSWNKIYDCPLWVVFEDKK